MPSGFIYPLAAIPGIWAFHLAISDQLGADPAKSLERILGLWALRFLVLGLAISPLRRFAGVNLLRYRRALGLTAFFYAAAHLITYVWLDRSLEMAEIIKDIIKRPYITIGMLSFAILIALAITSNAASIKRLGARWQKLHRWVYLACAAAALHFLLLVKSITAEPALYAFLVAVLLALRAIPKSPQQRRRTV